MKTKKNKYSILKIFLILIFFPIYIIFIFIKIIIKKKIRLYQISNIMGNSGYIELYLSEKMNNMHEDYCDIFFLESSFNIIILQSNKFNYFWSITLLNNCNNLKINNRFVIFLFSFFWEITFKYLELSNQFSLFKNFLKIPIYTHNQITDKIIYNSKISNNKNSLIIIDKKNYITCEKQYKKIENELSINRPIVTILNRDSAYKNFTNPNRNWSYHDFRNSQISDFVEASNYLIKKGYFVIRHGNKSLEEMKIKNKYFFDYSKSKYRSSHMDVYLIKRSSFFLVVGGSGPWIVASFFNTPIGHINWLHLKYLPTYCGKSIFIPKKIFDISKNKFLPFSNYLDPNYRISKISNLPLGLYTHNEEYENEGIKLIDNSPIEIMKLAGEMNLLTNNKLNLDEEDSKLQNIFWSIFKSDFPYSRNFLISPYFLRNNQSLLE